jgi:hypothetical protein
MVPRQGRPLQTWKTFLRNHAEGIASMDLFVVPTVAFEQHPGSWYWAMADAGSFGLPSRLSLPKTRFVRIGGVGRQGSDVQ